MNKLFYIKDQDGEILSIRRKKYYDRLGDTKRALKEYISRTNSKKPKLDRLHYESFEVVECEMVVREVHKI